MTIEPTRSEPRQSSGRDLSTDHLRPRHHIAPRWGWLNDPNGLVKLDGRYHVFYQHNPSEAAWGNIHWGHVSSRDLVRWRHEPIALRPEAGGPDADGCWSGSAVMGPDGPVVFYTGRDGDRESVCIAHGDANLEVLRKDLGNPVLGPPHGLLVSDFRDPKVWRDGDGWRMLVGAGLTDGPGAILQYRSTDLYRWESLGPLITGPTADVGEAWECPDLFAVDGRHTLIYSITPGEGSTRYVSGALGDRSFRVDQAGSMDMGPYFYAAQALVEEDGRCLVWGWLREGRTVEAQRSGGWSGALSLPRVVTMDAAGRLLMQPAPELEILRGTGRHAGERALRSDEPHDLGTDGHHGWEGRIRFATEDGARLRLAVCVSPDGSEQTLIELEPGGRTVMIDRRRSSTSSEVDRSRQTLKLEGSPDETRGAPSDETDVRIFIDGSIIEMFIDGVSVTTRVYPTREDSTGAHLEAIDGTVWLRSVDWWPLEPVAS